MQFFIGIVPPVDVKEKIIRLQNTFSDRPAIEPHITVKSLSGLTADKVWIPKVEEYIKRQHLFPIKLGDTNWFDEAVLFLSVASPKIHLLHKGLLEIVDPGPELRREHFEGQYYVPHLTLAELKKGIPKTELQSMELNAKQELAEIPEFYATFARIFVRADSEGPCVKLMDIPFDAGP